MFWTCAIVLQFSAVSAQLSAQTKKYNNFEVFKIIKISFLINTPIQSFSKWGIKGILNPPSPPFQKGGKFLNLL